MMQPQHQLDVKNLSIAERILLVEDIWDSIAAEQESLEITKAQRDELDHRFEAYQASPTLGTSWEDVKAKLRAER